MLVLGSEVASGKFQASSKTGGDIASRFLALFDRCLVAFDLKNHVALSAAMSLAQRKIINCSCLAIASIAQLRALVSGH